MDWQNFDICNYKCQDLRPCKSRGYCQEKPMLGPGKAKVFLPFSGKECYNNYQKIAREKKD